MCKKSDVVVKTSGLLSHKTVRKIMFVSILNFAIVFSKPYNRKPFQGNIYITWIRERLFFDQMSRSYLHQALIISENKFLLS
jgi:hypothetical protein